jgi:hypothetical protein
MGCYINPRNQTKEEFLREHGEPTSTPCEVTETHLPVVLVNNGPFTAAGVAYDNREREAFLYPDPRPKQWFRVSREELRKVSDLARYEK